MLSWIRFQMIPGEHNLVPVVFGVAFVLFLLPGVCSGLIISLKHLKQPWFMFSFGTDLHRTIRIVILSR